MSFDITGCQLHHFGPHPTLPGRTVGTVRVRIREVFMGNTADYTLDLKVKADNAGEAPEMVQRALLAHAAHQLNRLKARHAARQAAE
jgi:hypothetical protein